mmetsp:Transcript_40461/g.114593  ORF Transcript_40461/g.114593 Transcript_40461/m.114593 type:complete len:118 (-) Transcript_40461:529-882(-)
MGNTDVDITKTWCDTERLLEGLRPAMQTLMAGEGVQYESAAALIAERIRAVQRNCRLARKASKKLNAEAAARPTPGPATGDKRAAADKDPVLPSNKKPRGSSGGGSSQGAYSAEEAL